ncbi:hypothetical protein [Dactylosporangium sp. NPDC006015]|uniref:hypothetical protein n=1 Tax=Dactylosporangium sp. NPDC006015 TaxID=3154576 RepID=UPI0033A61642
MIAIGSASSAASDPVERSGWRSCGILSLISDNPAHTATWQHDLSRQLIRGKGEHERGIGITEFEVGHMDSVVEFRQLRQLHPYGSATPR